MPAAGSDLEPIAIPAAVKLAGGLLMGAGVALGIMGLQIMLLLVLDGAYQLIGPAAVMLSGGCVFFGWGTVRANLPAARLGLAAGLATFVFACGWIMLAFVHGTLPFIALAVVLLSSVAYVVLRRELPQIRKIEAARERLRTERPDAA